MNVPFPHRAPLRRKAAFGLTVFVGFWVIAELTLRVVGFRFSTNVETMAFTFPIDEFNDNSEQPFLQRDDHLFWKPKPYVLGHNSRGMIGPEFTDSKPSGVFRIVCIGDSCTHFGPDSYPEKLQTLLNESAPGRFEVINAGCIGYTSFQGLTLLREQVLNWSPDLVTVYFGWNDHWLAKGYRDVEQESVTPEASTLKETFESLRVCQFLEWSLNRVSAPSTLSMRVEPDEYRQNLRTMYDLCSQSGTDIWYLTAPHAFEHGLPEFLRTSGEVADPTKVAQLHDSYNAVVRTVAEDLDTVCLDLASQFNDMDKRPLFVEDHIHLSDAGRLLASKTLLESLDRHGILDQSSRTDK